MVLAAPQLGQLTPQVAQAGRIVLLSFHQPSPAMYDMLDRAFLMSKGHIVFCGEPGAAYEHFEHAGMRLSCAHFCYVGRDSRAAARCTIELQLLQCTRGTYCARASYLMDSAAATLMCL